MRAMCMPLRRVSTDLAAAAGGGGYPNSSAGRGGKGTVIIRRIAFSYGPNPILDGVVTNAILQTSAQLAVSIASIGDNASSATCELRWGDSPSSLSRTAAYSGSITGAGQYAVDVGITLGCTYYGKFVVVNNNGKSAETAVFSFIALARKLRATGGDVVFDDGDYRVMMFTNFVETAYLDVQQGALVEALFVGGGGAGGGSNTAGGGGGGGVLHVAEFPITVGRWPVTVGAGGVPSPSKGNGGNGGDTVFLGTVAYGGGGGASDGTGLKGASGGGGGGASHYNNNFGYGGAGGSGCVILRYQVRGINEGFFISIR